MAKNSDRANRVGLRNVRIPATSEFRSLKKPFDDDDGRIGDTEERSVS
jgi:hypothetical protein